MVDLSDEPWEPTAGMVGPEERLLRREDYPELFAVLDAEWGRRSAHPEPFVLPDLRDRPLPH